MTNLPEMLKSMRCDRAANDRRRSPRVGLRARVALRTLDDRTHAAWLRDVSVGGAGLLLERELPVDSSVLLDLSGPQGDAVEVRCRVAHCTKVGGFWRAGVQFIHKPWREPAPQLVPLGPSESDLDREMRRLSEAVMD